MFPIPPKLSVTFMSHEYLVAILSQSTFLISCLGTMSRVWALFKAHPYLSNVVGYTALFTSADLIQQCMLGGTSKKGHKMASDGADGNLSVDRPEETLDGTSKRSSSSGTKTVSALAGIDWSQTARVAVVGFCFHANFNYHWLRGLEKMFPGGGAKRVSGKVILDQLIAAPATISAFFIGMFLELPH